MCLNNWYITDNNSVRVKHYAKTYVTRRNRWIIKDYAKARFTLHNTFYKVADKFTHARSIPLNRPIWKWIESFGRLECHLFLRPLERFEACQRTSHFSSLLLLSWIITPEDYSCARCRPFLLFPLSLPLHLPPLINDKRRGTFLNYRSGGRGPVTPPEISWNSFARPEITDFIFENFPPRPTYVVRRTKLVREFKFLSTRYFHQTI